MLTNKQFFHEYNLDALTYKYGRIGDSQGYAIQGKWGAATSGSSTTVTSLATGYAFAPVNVGDTIIFRTPPDTTTIRKVATKVSNVEITVSAAVNLGTGGVAWEFLPFRIGATDADGWHHSRTKQGFSIFLNVATLAASGGLTARVQGLVSGSLTPIDLVAEGETDDEVAITAAGTYELRFKSPVQQVRLGLKAVTSATGTDVISAWMQELTPSVM